MRRDFDIRGGLTLYAGEHTEPARHKIAKVPNLNVTLRGRICEACNNGFLSQLENTVRPILSPMMLRAEPAVLERVEQTLLATWAVKTALLFELAIRQGYPASRSIPGYAATPQEFAWLWAERTPPPRSLVWLACWDCRQTNPLMYEPSGAPLPTVDGPPVAGHLTTFSIGFVALQVFTVDFLAADQHGAMTWNTMAPQTLSPALLRIWPTAPLALAWPPKPFAHEDWQQLVTWDGALRPDDALRGA